MSESCKLSRNSEKYIKKADKIICHQKKETQNMRLTNSISANFTNQASIQCCSAIEMCENILCFTTSISTQELADDLKCLCEKFLKQIEELNDRCLRAANQRQELYYYQNNFEEIAERMFRRLEKMCDTNDIDQNFRNYVRIFCESMICMCENVLKFRILPEVRELAEEMKKCFKELLEKMERTEKCE